MVPAQTQHRCSNIICLGNTITILSFSSACNFLQAAKFYFFLMVKDWLLVTFNMHISYRLGNFGQWSRLSFQHFLDLDVL